jgi:hypothetical protein
MQTHIKALLAPAAVAAMSLAAATPAMAQVGYDYGHNRGWGQGGSVRQAVNACSRVAERTALRRGYDHANVSNVRDVRNTRWGFEIRGRINVHERGGWHDGHRNGWRGNDWRDGGRYRDTGTFSCRVERGRVVALDIDGIRGL